MAKGTPFVFFFLFLLHSVLLLCNSALSSVNLPAKDSSVMEEEEDEEQRYISVPRKLINYFRYDSIDPPTTPTTSPVTFPPDNSPPVIVTVPGTNPAGISSPVQTTNNPGTTPVNTPSSVTNPVTTPTPSTIPQAQPISNPVTANPPPFGGGTSPVIPPPVVAGGGGGGNAPAGQGQSWCVARTGASQTQLQSALDYACGIGGADCSMIQQGASCYNPASLQNHASYAFNSYYQKNPAPTSCDFGGAAALTNTNPSTGSCVYPSSATSTSSSSPATSTPPATQSPYNPTTQSPYNPTTNTTPTPTLTPPSSSGSTMPGIVPPPPGFSIGNPGLGGPATGFAASPPLTDNSMPSMSNALRPFNSYLLIVTSIAMGRLVVGM